jgi:hypothetical protein
MEKLTPLPESDDEDSLFETQKKVLKELKRQNAIIVELLETQKQHSAKIERMFQLHVILDTDFIDRYGKYRISQELRMSEIIQRYICDTTRYMEQKTIQTNTKRGVATAYCPI